MAFGERLRFYRTLRGLTQKYLGIAAGFSEKSADVRLAQYESGIRTPKAELTAVFADALDISPYALTVPDYADQNALMHTLFALEDTCGLEVVEIDGKMYLHIEPSHSTQASSLDRLLHIWHKKLWMKKHGKISEEVYNQWRYQYPGTKKNEWNERAV